MKTADFIATSLGCYKSDCIFIDILCDNFPSFDLDQYDVRDFDPNQIDKGARLCNHLISCFYQKIIDGYVKKGLNECDFSTDVNSYTSTISYEGVVIGDEDDLDIILNRVRNEKEGQRFHN